MLLQLGKMALRVSPFLAHPPAAACSTPGAPSPPLEEHQGKNVQKEAAQVQDFMCLASLVSVFYMFPTPSPFFSLSVFSFFVVVVMSPNPSACPLPESCHLFPTLHPLGAQSGLCALAQGGSQDAQVVFGLSLPLFSRKAAGLLPWLGADGLSANPPRWLLPLQAQACGLRAAALEFSKTCKTKEGWFFLIVTFLVKC